MLICFTGTVDDVSVLYSVEMEVMCVVGGVRGGTMANIRRRRRNKAILEWGPDYIGEGTRL